MSVIHQLNQDEHTEDYIMEDCIKCGNITSMWWGDGCAPLCTCCAEKTTYEEMVKICEAEGHGPIPDKD